MRYYIKSCLIIGLVIGCITKGYAIEPENQNITLPKEAGVTPLIRAAARGDALAVTTFIKTGSIVNQQNLGGASALHLASRNNHLEVVKVLVENGANINLKDNDEWTPLMRASLNGNSEIVAFLLENHADIWTKNKWGESALMHGTMAKCTECIYHILEKAGKRYEDSQYQTIKQQLDSSLIIAKQKNDNQSAEILEGALVALEECTAIDEEGLGIYGCLNERLPLREEEIPLEQEPQLLEESTLECLEEPIIEEEIIITDEELVQEDEEMFEEDEDILPIPPEKQEKKSFWQRIKDFFTGHCKEEEITVSPIDQEVTEVTLPEDEISIYKEPIEMMEKPRKLKGITKVKHNPHEILEDSWGYIY